MSNLDQDSAEWLDEMFEFEYCAECGGDQIHHTAVPFMGNWFARCDYVSEDEQNYHPEVVSFREAEGHPIT